MAQPFDITKGSGNSVLSKIGGLPDFSSPQTAKDLSGRLQAHTNRVNYFKRMAEQAMQNGNQNSAQAYINQAMAEYDKASAVQDQLAYVQRVSAQRERTDRNAMSRAQARVERNNPVLSSIMDTKPAQIGAMVGGEILRMFDDTAKAGGKALEYLERSLKPTAQNADQAFYNRDFTVSGDPESVMSPEQTINLKDVAKEIGVAGAKNAGTYLDAMNSVRHWFMNNEWGSKPDSEDEKYRKMFGKGAREALGGRELQDPTISRGADVVVDPLAVVPAVGRASRAVTDPKLWEGIARDISFGTRSNMIDPDALRIAQINASKPISDGGLGLRPDNTPEERALAMGFVDDVYHATDKSFSQFSPSSKGKLGAGIYTSPIPSYTEKYIGNSRPPRKFLNDANIMPLKTSGKYANREEHAVASELARNELSHTGKPVMIDEWKALTNEILQKQGFSGIDMGGERLVFDPKDVRSRFAMFDPMRRNSKDIMAGLALPAVTIPAMLEDKK